jgi:aarF domain-containing kinase
LARNDGRTVARFVYEGSPRQDVRDYPEYEEQVCKMVAKTQGKSLNELEMSVLIGTIFDILRKNRLRADASFTTINIAMIVVEGLGKTLDPDLDIFQAIQPHLVGVLANAPEVFRTVVTDDMPPPQP